MTTITALRGLSIDQTKTDRFTKSADTLQAPASTIKMMTAYTARKWVNTSNLLGSTITVVSGDLVGGSTANLAAGDILTYENAFYGMMLPSGNDAAMCVARNVGQIILNYEGASGDPITRFLAEMNNVATGLGWSGCVFSDPTGLSANNRMSIRQLVNLISYINTFDSWLCTVMGTLSHNISVTGSNPRTIAVLHTIDPNGSVKFPEFVAGKTGTTSEAGACLVMLWDHPDGTRHATGVLNSTTNSRYNDVRTIIDSLILGWGIGAWTRSNNTWVEAKAHVVFDGVLVPLA